jgi:hypothetical protein
MKSIFTTKALGVIGSISWAGTIFLRGTTLNSIPILNFILGIAPNIAAAWLFAFLIENIYFVLLKRKIKQKEVISSLIFILGLSLGSEIIHDIFLGSPFDVNDIVATSFALIIFLIVFYLNNKVLIFSQKN